MSDTPKDHFEEKGVLEEPDNEFHGVTVSLGGRSCFDARLPEIEDWIGGRYRITKSLGRGGAGAVFLAYDKILDAEVALKFVDPEVIKDAVALDRLRAEVLLARKITHRNVCRTHGLVESDGYLFIDMEYIVGETLADRCQQRGRLGVDEALDIARAIADGLEAVHREGVVHRDLKPENILIRRDNGSVVLTDFGLAHSILNDDDGILAGTPAYMAPEQLRREHVDGRTDLYALGCVLYEMLCGRVPFPQVVSFPTAIDALTHPLPDPTSAAPELPAWLSQLIRRLLARTPAERYRNARAVRNILDKPLRARRRWIVWSIGISMVCLLSMPVVIIKTQTRWKNATEARRPAKEENVTGIAISPDGQWVAYSAEREGQWGVYIESIQNNSPSRMLGLGSLGFLRTLRWTADSRGLLGVDANNQAIHIFLDGTTREIAQAVSQIDDCGGRWVVAQQGSEGCHECTSVRIYSGPEIHGQYRELFRLSSNQLLRDMRCDRRGSWLTYKVAVTIPSMGIVGDLYVMAVDGGKPPRQLTFDQKTIRYPVFSHDSRTVLFVSERGASTDLWEISLHGGAPVPVATGAGCIGAFDLSPDGQVLMYSDEIESFPLFVHGLDTSASRRILPGIDRIAFSPQMMPGNQDLLVLSALGFERRRAIVDVAKVEKSKQVAVISPRDGRVRALAPADIFAVSADTKEVIFAQNAQPESKIDAMPLAGGPARHIAAVRGKIAVLAVGADRNVHFSMTRAGETTTRTCRVPLAGGPIVEQNAPGASIVLPAPRGNWRLVGYALNREYQYRWHLVAPDRPLSDQSAAGFEARRWISWMPDGTSFISYDGSEVKRHYVGTGRTDVLLKSELLEGGIALSADGKSLYYSQWTGRAQRQMITNFADRPRPISWFQRLLGRLGK